MNVTGLTITGDLTVNGTTTTVNSTTLTVDDKNIELGSTASPSNSTANGGGITLKGSTDKTITWDNSATPSWNLSENLNLVSGKTVKINNTDVLTSTSLGSSVVSSSLTSLGTVTSLNATYGNISNLTSSTPNFYGPLTNTGTSTFSGRVDISEIRETVSSVSVFMRNVNMQLCRWLRILYSKYGWNDFKLHYKCNQYSYR